MKIIPFQYRAGDGFSSSPLPHLEHPDQLLLVFGSPRMDEDEAPFKALADANRRAGGFTRSMDAPRASISPTPT